MSPKLLSSESSKLSSPSRNFGGVAVLAELAVVALSLLPGVNAVIWVVFGDGRAGGEGWRETSFFDLLAKEKLRPAFLNDHPRERDAGGTGISWKGR